MGCTHPTFCDHTDGGVRDDDGRLVWTCSNCGLKGPWSETWGYYGNYECRNCQTADMQWVACSEKCALALHAKHGTKPDKSRNKVEMSEGIDILGDQESADVKVTRRPAGEQRKPRKRRMTIRDKARAYDQLVAEGKIKLTP